MKNLYLLTLSLILGVPGFTQTTLDDFNDGMTTGWATPNDGANFHTYTEAGGELQIDFDVAQPTWYSRSTFTFPSGVDMSTLPVVRVAMRTENLSQSITVRVDLIDGNTYTTNGVPFNLVPLVDDGNVAIYEWDMTARWYATFWNGNSGYWPVDSTNVTALEFFINANGAIGADSLWLDYIEIDSVMMNTGATDGDITFSVDMNNYTDPFTGVYVNSSLNSWCGACWPLDDPDMDGIWEATIPDEVLGNHEFLFTVDGWADQEVLQGANAFNCANQFNNRILDLVGDTILPTYCWESCTDCASDPCIGVPVDVSIIEDGECQFNAVYDPWEAGWWWIPNPDMSGINTSAGVYSYTKYFQDGIVRAVATEAPLSLNLTDQFMFDVWQDLGQLLVLVQPLDLDTLPTLGNYFDTLNTLGAWEEVRIDLSGISNDPITGFHFFIGVGDASTTNMPLYVDNMRLEGTVGVTELMSEGPSVFPNPAKDVINVMASPDAVLTLYDLTGRIILSDRSGGASRVLHTGDLTRGAYVLEVESNGIRRAERIILE